MRKFGGWRQVRLLWAGGRKLKPPAGRKEFYRLWGRTGQGRGKNGLSCISYTKNLKSAEVSEISLKWERDSNYTEAAHKCREATIGWVLV